MEPGQLDRRITIQQRVLGNPPVTGAGEENSTWQEVATVWAARRDVRGEEFLAQFGRQAEVTCTFKLRYRAGITPQMRVVDGGETYEIQHIARLGRKEALELWAKAIEGASAP